MQDVAIVKVFVSSPSDLAEERDLLKEVEQKLNLLLGETNNLRVEIVNWETNTRPGTGSHPQEVINRQIGDNYDIFLGLMWGRFGTETDEFGSGTEEEFQRAYQRKQDGDPDLEVMFYFKTAALVQEGFDPDQFKKVLEFKKTLGSDYGQLYHEFETPDDFASKVHVALGSAAQQIVKRRRDSVVDSDSDDVGLEDSVSESTAEFDPLANLNAVTDDEDDQGFLDLSERLAESSWEVFGILKRISNAIDSLGESTAKRTQEANNAVALDSHQMKLRSKHMAKRASEDLKLFVKRMAIEIPAFNDATAEFNETLSRMVLLSGSDSQTTKTEVAEAIEAIHSYEKTIGETSSSLKYLQSSIESVPKLSTTYNRARKRAIAVLEDFIEQIRINANQIKAIETLLLDQLKGSPE